MFLVLVRIFAGGSFSLLATTFDRQPRGISGEYMDRQRHPDTFLSGTDRQVFTYRITGHVNLHNSLWQEERFLSRVRRPCRFSDRPRRSLRLEAIWLVRGLPHDPERPAGAGEPGYRHYCRHRPPPVLSGSKPVRQPRTRPNAHGEYHAWIP